MSVTQHSATERRLSLHIEPGLVITKQQGHHSSSSGAH